MADKRRRPAAAKSREELRRENRQELERKKHRRNALLIIGLVAVTVLAAVILSLTVFFNITAVEVDASKTQYSADQIRKASGISEGDNLFLMDREEVAERVSTGLPYTGEITVKRKLPGKVRIYVEDSTIAAAVRYNDQFIVLNDTNKVLAKVGSVDSLNELVEQQTKKKKAAAAKKKKTASTTKKTTTAADPNTTADPSATTTTTTTTDAAAATTEEVRMEDIVGGEDLGRVTDSVTVITGIKVKEAKVGYPLKASNADVFETYREIRAAMDRWGVKDITAVDLTKITDIRLTYQKRIRILLGSASGLDRKAAMCAKVIEEQDKVSTEQKGTIDLSIDGKAYFSEGGATTRTTTLPTTTLPTEVVTDVDGNPLTTDTTAATDTSATTVSATSGTGESTTADPSSTTATTQDPADIGG